MSEEYIETCFSSNVAGWSPAPESHTETKLKSGFHTIVTIVRIVVNDSSDHSDPSDLLDTIPTTAKI